MHEAPPHADIFPPLEGEEPRFRAFDPASDGDPLEFVVVTNLHRRHLTPSQCAMVGADLATMRQGARTDLRQPSASLPEVSQAQASRLSTASERGVRSAVFVKKEGSRDLVQAVRAFTGLGFLQSAVHPDDQSEGLSPAGPP
jgi:hypothetical protein